MILEPHQEASDSIYHAQLLQESEQKKDTRI